MWRRIIRDIEPWGDHYPYSMFILRITFTTTGLYRYFTWKLTSVKEKKKSKRISQHNWPIVLHTRRSRIAQLRKLFLPPTLHTHTLNSIKGTMYITSPSPYSSLLVIIIIIIIIVEWFRLMLPFSLLCRLCVCPLLVRVVPSLGLRLLTLHTRLVLPPQHLTLSLLLCTQLLPLLLDALPK